MASNDRKQGLQTTSQPLFDPQTMSGISPGRRTRAFQRFRMGVDDSDRDLRWIRLLWDEDVGDNRIGAELAVFDADHSQWVPTDIDIPPGESRQAVMEHLATLSPDNGPELCGSCDHWNATSTHDSVDIPFGDCTFRVGAEVSHPALVEQSYFALACLHWERTDDIIGGKETPSQPPPMSGEELTAARESSLLHREIEEAQQGEIESIALTAKSGWRRWMNRIQEYTRRSPILRDPDPVRRDPRGRPQRPTPNLPPPAIAERSGIGAGTEPCAACSGRTANLAGVTSTDAAGDPVTYSLWRCRLCRTLYLNRWIDRWVRLDNLEIEEGYYRVAPNEATYLYGLINSAEASDMAAQLEQFTAERAYLSHQIRQGR